MGPNWGQVLWNLSGLNFATDESRCSDRFALRGVMGAGPEKRSGAVFLQPELSVLCCGVLSAQTEASTSSFSASDGAEAHASAQQEVLHSVYSASPPLSTVRSPGTEALVSTCMGPRAPG